MITIRYCFFYFKAVKICLGSLIFSKCLCFLIFSNKFEVMPKKFICGTTAKIRCSQLIVQFQLKILRIGRVFGIHSKNCNLFSAVTFFEASHLILKQRLILRICAIFWELTIRLIECCPWKPQTTFISGLFSYFSNNYLSVKIKF